MYRQQFIEYNIVIILISFSRQTAHMLFEQKREHDVYMTFFLCGRHPVIAFKLFILPDARLYASHMTQTILISHSNNNIHI